MEVIYTRFDPFCASAQWFLRDDEWSLNLMVSGATPNSFVTLSAPQSPDSRTKAPKHSITELAIYTHSKSEKHNWVHYTVFTCLKLGGVALECVCCSLFSVHDTAIPT